MLKKYALFTILFISIAVLSKTVIGQPTTFGDTLGAFNAGILTPTPDRALVGVEYVNGSYWMTGFDPDDNWQHKLYKLDASTKSMDTVFSYGQGVAGWKDLAFDGTYLYVADIGAIRQIDTSTGQTTSLSISSPIYYNSGLAYDPANDHFWVSGDGSLIYELDKGGNVINSVSLPQQYPATGLAWDTVSPGGPYLWVWSVKYTSNDVRPKALQINPANGTMTNVSFEGVIMHPNGNSYGEQSLGACISQDAIPGKTVFIGMQQSSYQQANDQLDWVVLYDLAPDSVGIPGGEITTSPAAFQNNLLPGDSLDVALYINNLSANFDLDWSASVQYPGIIDSNAVLGDTLDNFDFSAITPSINNRLQGIAYIDSFAWVTSARDFNNRVFLYQYDLVNNVLINVDTLNSFLPGFNAVTSDGRYIYAALQYTILQYDPVNKQVIANFPKIGFSPGALAYDPQKELFYMGGSTGALKIIDKQGTEQGFFVTPYNIQGLAWDNWSQGGPYLWAFHLRESDTTMQVIRLDPNTGGATGVDFIAPNLSGDPALKDFPAALSLANDWKEGKLVMLALHESNTSPGDGHDRLVAYDLATAPAPGWITLLPTSYGSLQPSGQDTLNIRLNAIMDDTLMMAEIIIKSNDVFNPLVSIPVNFQMLPSVAVGLGEQTDLHSDLIRRVFPNPARDVLNVDLTGMEGVANLSLYNALGMQVREMRSTGGQDILRINTQDLQPGVYVLRVESLGQYSSVESRKVIIR